jgi:homoprotocatechuate degradation regulator HpaR
MRPKDMIDQAAPVRVSNLEDSGTPDASARSPMRAFGQSLPMALLRARAAVMERFRPLHVERGLTEQQWRILRVLFETGEMDALSLANATFLMAPSLSRILPPLEARGLIGRRVDQADARRSLISLMPAGHDMILAHGPRSEAAYADIERRFGEARLAKLFEELHALEAALATIDP